MKVNPILAILIIALSALIIVAVVLPLALMYLLPVSISRMDDLMIRDVQFDDDCLMVTVENTCIKTKTVNKVTIRNLKIYDHGFFVDWDSPPYNILVDAPILEGEEISIRLEFNWISGHAYRVQLETEDPKDWSPATEYNAIAP